MLFYLSLKKTDLKNYTCLSLPNNVWRLIVFAPFLIIIIIILVLVLLLSYPCTMNLSTADLGNYRTEFHETWCGVIDICF